MIQAATSHRPNTAKLLRLDSYDIIIVCYSGGKDSLACLLHIVEQLRSLGLTDTEIAAKIEVWHQGIDGDPDSEGLMDWPCTTSYVRATTKAFGLRCFFQWRHGGFEREMTKCNEQSQPISFEEVDGSTVTKESSQSKVSTRQMFPQRSADLSVRWCSSQLKIDVSTKALNNSRRFQTGRFLMVTGERRAESAARANYAEVERHRSHTVTRRNGKTVRVVHQWRAVIDWTEQEVWDIIRKNRVAAHPAYYLGFGRVSCMCCIFGNRDQWATVRELAPNNFYRVASYEEQFGKTIHRTESVIQQASQGQSFLRPGDEQVRRLAISRDESALSMWIKSHAEDWQMPRGAFKRCGGPT